LSFFSLSKQLGLGCQGVGSEWNIVILFPFETARLGLNAARHGPGEAASQSIPKSSSFPLRVFPLTFRLRTGFAQRRQKQSAILFADDNSLPLIASIHHVTTRFLKLDPEFPRHLETFSSLTEHVNSHFRPVTGTVRVREEPARNSF